MKKWYLKALIQKVIAALPGSHRINYFFQRYVTGGVRLNDQYYRDKAQHALDHLRHFHQSSKNEPFISLEIGTGWYPIVPLYMFLAGAQKIYTVDITPLLSYRSLSQTVQFIQKEVGKSNAWNEELRTHLNPDRCEKFMQIHPLEQSFPELLASLHLEVLVGDARELPLKDASVDLIHSNNTFEHIDAQVLVDILEEFARILRPAGLMSHFIDMSDHFAHMDSSISIYNFLRYSEKTWQRIDNKVQPQNRLRLPDYEAMLRQCGFCLAEREIRPGDLTLLQTLSLSSPFTNYKPEDIAISHAHLIHQKTKI